MKKAIAWLAWLVGCSICLSLAACVPKLESVVFDQTSVILDNGGSVPLTYTVKPANARAEVFIAIEDESVVTYADGILTAVTTGSTTVRLVSQQDETCVYSTCTVQVDPPAGYAAYDNGDMKLVYPVDWIRSDSLGITMFQDAVSGSNLNITREDKTDSYQSMTAEDFKAQITAVYELLGISVDFRTAELQKSEYLGVPRITVALEYSLLAAVEIEISQTQFIQDAGESTYCVTVTQMTAEDAGVADVVQREFVSLR